MRRAGQNDSHGEGRRPDAASAYDGFCVCACDFAGGLRLTAEQTKIIDTVSTIFAAAHAEDVKKFDAVTSSDFYIFDGGARFNGEALMALMRILHAAGRRYEWNVTEPDVHISGNTAWIAYVNKGSVTDASGTVNQNWLESAVLEKRAGTWKVVFMHSTRVLMLTQENHGK